MNRPGNYETIDEMKKESLIKQELDYQMQLKKNAIEN